MKQQKNQIQIIHNRKSYLNEYLHGFSKEQLDIGVMNGEIKFENLNLRPDGINQKMDEKNIPFWLKAGLISKISIKCSIMNFIGEKPLDVLIEDIDIITVDVDKHPDLAREYGVMSIPTLVIIKNGQVANQFVGLTSKHEIEEAI